MGLEKHQDEVALVRVAQGRDLPGAVVTSQRDHPGLERHRSSPQRLGSEQDRRGAVGGRHRGRPARAPLHPRRPHGQDLRLLVEPERAVGDLLGERGQHHAGVADGREHLQRRRGRGQLERAREQLRRNSKTKHNTCYRKINDINTIYTYITQYKLLIFEFFFSSCVKKSLSIFFYAKKF